MFKKLIRLTVALIFGSLILMNVSLAYSYGSMRAEESHRGTGFTSSNRTMIVICDGGPEPECMTIEDQE